MARYNNNAHLARATLEAICYQSRDVVEAMEQDSSVHLDVLRVDGGVTANDLCMQIQADVLGVPVSRPVVAETTALGAAYAAGLATGFWRDTDELRTHWSESRRWEPQWSERPARAGSTAGRPHQAPMRRRGTRTPSTGPRSRGMETDLGAAQPSDGPGGPDRRPRTPSTHRARPTPSGPGWSVHDIDAP
ncbi:Glycerol kinase [Streptomyces tendae]